MVAVAGPSSSASIFPSPLQELLKEHLQGVLCFLLLDYKLNTAVYEGILAGRPVSCMVTAECLDSTAWDNMRFWRPGVAARILEVLLEKEVFEGRELVELVRREVATLHGALGSQHATLHEQAYTRAVRKLFWQSLCAVLP